MEGSETTGESVTIYSQMRGEQKHSVSMDDQEVLAVALESVHHRAPSQGNCMENLMLRMSYFSRVFPSAMLYTFPAHGARAGTS